MNQNIKLLTLAAFAAAVTLGLSSCGTTAPLKQRDAALLAISRAQTVEAPTYAETLFMQAQDNYDGGQELIVETKKSAQNKKAQQLYLSAKELAAKAYQKAVAPFTQAFLDATAVLLENAKIDKIDRASETLYSQAATAQTNAQTQQSEKKFTDAYEISKSARKTLAEAVADAARLRARIAEQQKLIDRLRAEALQKKATNAVPEEYQSSIEFAANINEAFEEGYYAQVLEDHQELIAAFKDLIVLIEVKKQEAIRELANAERTIDQLKKQRVTVDEEISKLNAQYQDN